MYCATIFISLLCAVTASTWIHNTVEGQQSTPFYFQEGQTLRLVCEQDDPNVDYARWLKDNTPVSESIFQVLRVTDEGNNKKTVTLLKSEATSEDDGQYSCSDSSNTDAAPYTVDVTVLRGLPKNAVVDIDEKHPQDVSIACLWEGLNSKPSIAWHRDGVPIDSPEKYTIDQFNSSLTIHNTVSDDIGEYMCSAIINEYTTFNQTVSVEGGPGVEPFKSSKNLVQGEDLKLNCEPLGYPKPTVHWLHEEEPIDYTDSRISLSEHEGFDNATLTIKSVDYDDAGHYTCVATNFEGRSGNSTILVRVKDKLAALWPFLGIVAEVTILCIIIFIYEKRRAKRMAENEEPEEAHLTNSNDHKEGAVRQRKS